MSTFMSEYPIANERPGFYCLPVPVAPADGAIRRRDSNRLVWGLYADFLVDWERNCAEDDCGQCNHALATILAATVRP